MLIMRHAYFCREKLARFKELVVLCSSDRMAATNDLQQGVTATLPSMQNYVAGVKETSTLKHTKRTGHRRSHSDNVSFHIHFKIYMTWGKEQIHVNKFKL